MILSLSFLALLPLSAGETCTLVVRVTGITSYSGTMNIALSHGADSYGKSWHQAVRALKAPVKSGQVLARFTGLAPGYYAVKCYHDVNSNGKLDKNLVGIPAEPFGFSNNHKARFGPPSWEKSCFLLEEDEHTIHIQLQNL